MPILATCRFLRSAPLPPDQAPFRRRRLARVWARPRTHSGRLLAHLHACPWVVLWPPLAPPGPCSSPFGFVVAARRAWFPGSGVCCVPLPAPELPRLSSPPWADGRPCFFCAGPWRSSRRRRALGARRRVSRACRGGAAASRVAPSPRVWSPPYRSRFPRRGAQTHRAGHRRCSIQLSPMIGKMHMTNRLSRQTLAPLLIGAIVAGTGCGSRMDAAGAGTDCLGAGDVRAGHGRERARASLGHGLPAGREHPRHRATRPAAHRAPGAARPRADRRRAAGLRQRPGRAARRRARSRVRLEPR